MSALVHCDGPDCDKAKDPNSPTRRLCDAGWIHVDQEGTRARDFHSRECLNDWADGGLRKRVEEVAADHLTGPISGTVMDWVPLEDLMKALQE